MGMKSKGYALVVCASLLCVGNVWGEGDCPVLGPASVPEAGLHSQVNGWTVKVNENPSEFGVNFKPEGKNEQGNCIYKNAAGNLLELSPPQ